MDIDANPNKAAQTGAEMNAVLENSLYNALDCV